MSKKIKQLVISEIRNRLADAQDMLVINSSKLDGVMANRFRLALRAKRIKALTVANSLAKQALDEARLKGLAPYLSGSTTLVWGGADIVALSKEIAKWAKDLEPLEIKGGLVEGKGISAQDVDALSKSPSREELIGQIVGRILGPGARLAGALLGPGGTLVSQFKTLADKESEAAAAPAAE